MEFLVTEETVGYGACLKTDSYNLWYLELVPLTHHIVSAALAGVPGIGGAAIGIAIPAMIARLF